MPIYEFKCKDCGAVFEHLQLGSPEKQPNCPHCQSGRLEKQFSSFATPKGGAFCPSGCGESGGCCGHNGGKCFN